MTNLSVRAVILVDHLIDGDGNVVQSFVDNIEINSENFPATMPALKDAVDVLKERDNILKSNVSNYEDLLSQNKRLISDLETKMLTAVNQFGQYHGKDKVKSIKIGDLKFSVKKTEFVFINDKTTIPQEFISSEFTITPLPEDRQKLIDFLSENEIPFTRTMVMDKTSIKKKITSGTIVPGADVLKKDSLKTK